MGRGVGVEVGRSWGRRVSGILSGLNERMEGSSDDAAALSLARLLVLCFFRLRSPVEVGRGQEASRRGSSRGGGTRTRTC